MLSASDLAIMRQALAPLRSTSAQIQRKTAASDGMGGQTVSWSVLATVNVRVTPTAEQDREVINEERLEQLDRYTVFLPQGQDISIRDRIVAFGTTYEVVAVSSPRTIEIDRQAQCIVVVS